MFTGFVRTVILYLVLIVGIRLMGKRQVGELEPSELVLSLVIADLAAVPMQDFGIPLLAGVIPILTLLALTMILSVLTMKHVGFRALLCGRPSVIIRRGKLDQGLPGLRRPLRGLVRHFGDQRAALRPPQGPGKAPHPGPVGPESNRVRASPGPHQRRACTGA